MLQGAFDEFEDAWNELADRNFLKAERIECRPLPNDGQMPSMDGDKKLILSCLSKKDSGAYVHCAIEKLAKIQNDFVRRAVTQAAKADCAGALKFFQRNLPPGQLQSESATSLAVPSKDLQKLFITDTIDYEWDDVYLQHGHNGLVHAAGTNVQYNYYRLEHQLALNVLFGAVDIETSSLIEFPFAGTKFSDKLDVLNEVRDIKDFRQEPVAPVDLQAVLQNPLMQKQENLALETLLVVMKTLCRTHHEDEPDDPLTQYVEQKMHNNLRTPQVSLIRDTMFSIRLCQLLALYEAIEDALTPIWMEHVNATYKSTMPEEARKELATWLSLDDNTLPESSMEPEPEIEYVSREELQTLNIRELKRRLQSVGVTDDALDRLIYDTDNPKEAMIVMLLGHNMAESEPAAVVVAQSESPHLAPSLATFHKVLQRFCVRYLLVDDYAGHHLAGQYLFDRRHWPAGDEFTDAMNKTNGWEEWEDEVCILSNGSSALPSLLLSHIFDACQHCGHLLNPDAVVTAVTPASGNVAALADAHNLQVERPARRSGTRKRSRRAVKS